MFRTVCGVTGVLMLVWFLILRKNRASSTELATWIGIAAILLLALSAFGPPPGIL